MIVNIIGVLFVVPSGIPVGVKVLIGLGMKVLMNLMPIRNTKVPLKIPVMSLHLIPRLRLIGKKQTLISDFETRNSLYKVTISLVGLHFL